MPSPSSPSRKPVKRALAGKQLQPRTRERSWAAGASSVAADISNSTVWMFFSFRRPICRVWMPLRFWTMALPK